jgi:hypothetical protein
MENLLKSVNESSKQANSAFVQSSKLHEVGEFYATENGSRGGTIYTLRPRADSIDVNASSIAAESKHPAQQIVAHPGRIDPGQFESADIVDKYGKLLVRHINVWTW